MKIIRGFLQIVCIIWILASVRCVTQVQVVEHKEKNKVKSDTLSKSPKIIKRKINANTRRTN